MHENTFLQRCTCVCKHTHMHMVYVIRSAKDSVMQCVCKWVFKVPLITWHRLPFFYGIKRFISLEVNDHIIQKINPILCRIMQKMFNVKHFLNGIISSSVSHQVLGYFCQG